MKSAIKILSIILLMLFSLRGFGIQVTKHHKKYPSKKQVYQRSKRESRMALQLRQGRIHEQQAKAVEKVQKKLAEEQKEQQ